MQAGYDAGGLAAEVDASQVVGGVPERVDELLLLGAVLVQHRVAVRGPLERAHLVLLANPHKLDVAVPGLPVAVRARADAVGAAIVIAAATAVVNAAPGAVRATTRPIR